MNMLTASTHELGRTALKMPVVTPKRTATAMLPTASSTVGPIRVRISSMTGRRERMDRPKSPVSTFFTKMRY